MMENQQFTVLIAGIAKAGMEDYVAHYLSDLMRLSREDDGCLIYNIHRSVTNPSEFMLYSVWRDEAAFNQHNQKPELRELKTKLANDLFEQQSPKTFWRVLVDE